MNAIAASIRKRKGFIHAIEGILASLLVLAYMSSVSIPAMQKNEWSTNALKQAGGEYLESAGRTNLSQLVIEDRKSTFNGISRYFFPEAQVSITPSSLPRTRIGIGVVSNYSGNPIIYFYNTSTSNAICNANGWITEYDCIVNASSPLGATIVLVDFDGGQFNGRLDYDTIYVGAKGPFLQNFIVQSGTEYYSAGYIDNSTKSAALWNASWTMRLNSNIEEAEINGRNISFAFVAASLDRPISQFDAIIIAGPFDISSYDAMMRSFLQQGKGIIEVANITPANFGGVQKSIFGIDNVSYALIGNSNASNLKQDTGLSDPAGPKEFFAGTAMKAETPVINAVGYDVSELPSPATVHLGYFVTSAGNATFAVSNSTGIIYDALYFDTNGDWNFSSPASDKTGYYEGDYFDMFGNTYFVRGIDTNGTYAKIKPSANSTLVGISNPLNMSWHGSGRPVLEEENYYSGSSNAVDSSFAIATNLGTLGNVNTLPSGDHKFGRLNQSSSNIFGANYNISATNSSANYTLLNIDFNNNGNYNDAGEGPFPTGDFVIMRPEKYMISIAPNGSSVSFKLKEREKIPISVANYLYAGRTIWMPDITGIGLDAWNYLRAAILWASEKKAVHEGISGSRNTVFIKRVFISSGDMYLPYEADAEFGQWS